MNETRCVICDEPTDLRQSLPVNNNGDVVPNSYQGEWGGMAACRNCVALHSAAGDNYDAVLLAYKTATEALRAKLTSLRGTLGRFEEMVRHAIYEAEK